MLAMLSVMGVLLVVMRVVVMIMMVLWRVRVMLGDRRMRERVRRGRWLWAAARVRR